MLVLTCIPDCDNDLQNGATTTTGCDMLCNGDNTQTCGGGYKLSVYRSSKTGPAPLQTYNNWGYQGCYTDTIAARTLPVGMAYAGSLTPQKCIDACASQNYNYAGLEYSVTAVMELPTTAPSQRPTVAIWFGSH
ncbi:hypothetical protein FRC15_007816 [Serendipita sp. 397]|nr:hypothetical protein FRC15_007816 [Serendipita sp. 397]